MFATKKEKRDRKNAYNEVFGEIKAGEYDDDLLMRAIADSDGDRVKAQTTYIQARTDRIVRGRKRKRNHDDNVLGLCFLLALCIAGIIAWAAGIHDVDRITSWAMPLIALAATMVYGAPKLYALASRSHCGNDSDTPVADANMLTSIRRRLSGR